MLGEREAATDAFDGTGNKFLVGGQGDKLIVLLAPKLLQGITHDEALNLAAWLVVMAYDAETNFEELLAEVKAL